MANGKVLTLYITMPDMMRSGNRMRVDDLDCDDNGIVSSKDYDNGIDKPIVLVCQKSYDLIEEQELVIERGLLMEDIHVDCDLYHLKAGSIIEIGEMLFEVTGSCEDYRYLYAFAPEIPDIIRGKRGLFLSPVEYGGIQVSDEVKVIKEV